MTPYADIEERALVWKIHWRLLPQLMAIQFIQMIDKLSMNYAGVMGLLVDTKITLSEFNWLGSIYYIGYFLFQFPNTILLHKFPISKYFGALIFGWGIVMFLTGIARNFAELAVLRLLLGLLEAPSYPIVFMLTSMMYRRDEQIIANSVFLLANTPLTLFGGLITYGIEHMRGLAGIDSWEWFMIIFGTATVGLGIVVFVFLPDNPRSKWLRLTPAQDSIVDYRIRDNGVVHNHKIQMYQIYEALREPRFYCFFFISMLTMLANGCVTLYSSRIVNEMGFSSLNAILLTVPQNIPDMILILISIYLRRRYTNVLCYIGSATCLIVMSGLLMLAFGTHVGVKLAGLYITCALDPSMLATETLIAHNVGGYTKKTVYNAAWVCSYCIGNFIAPLLMTDSQAPRYLGAMLTYAAGQGISAILFLYARALMARENRRRELLLTQGKSRPPPPPKDREKLDLTDVEDLHYVYIL
ncbi:major facilitator superfamily domain-containing protein [Fennellomyces sp. T-0311]|nr:major facilitator superfamily domain-containing protein [Fennellomyces sp. T-0311]